MVVGIVPPFCQVQSSFPRLKPLKNHTPQISLHTLIHPLYLPIYLKVVGSREVELNLHLFEQSVPELTSEYFVSIRDNALG